MLEGVDDMIEVEDSSFGESQFEDAPPDERDTITQKLQLLRRELFEIRDLLSSVH
jgi:hypothetical protein